MIRSTHIQDELNELKSSLTAGTGPVFNLPEGYFENFPRLMLERIKAGGSEAREEISEISPLLASISRKMPHSVPEHYFEEAALPTGSDTFLQGISKSMPYDVPAYYFEDLPDAILSRVWKPKAKVVTLRRRVMRLAVAAVITGLVAVSGWMIFGQKDGVSVTQTEQWVAQKLDDVSNQDLEEFINTADLDNASEPIAAGQKPEVKTMLNDVSDTELESFLAQIPEDEELSIN